MNLSSDGYVCLPTPHTGVASAGFFTKLLPGAGPAAAWPTATYYTPHPTPYPAAAPHPPIPRRTYYRTPTVVLPRNTLPLVLPFQCRRAGWHDLRMPPFAVTVCGAYAHTHTFARCWMTQARFCLPPLPVTAIAAITLTPLLRQRFFFLDARVRAEQQVTLPPAAWIKGSIS